jgi:hypothetical protein
VLIVNRISFILASASLLAGMSLCAQPDSLQAPAAKSSDSLYIRSYYQQLDLGMQYGTQFMEYSTLYPDGFEIVLRPNETWLLTPSLNYRWLSLSYSFTPAFINPNRDDEIRGKSTYRSLSTSLNFGRFSMNARWAKTEGFYLANTSDLYPTWEEGDPYVQFPDMRVRRFQFSTTYRTHKHFSLKAVTGGDEEQLRSAWTFLPSIHLLQFRFEVPGDDDKPGTTELTNNLDLHFTLPVAGTWVFAPHAFVSASAGPEVGVEFFRSLAYNQRSLLATTEGTRASLGYYYAINGGYNGPKWYTGLSAVNSRYQTSDQVSAAMGKRLFQISIYGGIRLNGPRLLRKSLDWAEKVFPFL